MTIQGIARITIISIMDIKQISIGQFQLLLDIFCQHEFYHAYCEHTTVLYIENTHFSKFKTNNVDYSLKHMNVPKNY